MTNNSLFLVVSAGLLDSFNPCAIAVLLIFIALMLTLKKPRKIIFTLGITYILAVYLTYFAIGLGLLKTMFLFNLPTIFSRIVGSVLIGWGLWSLKDYFFPKLPFRLSLSLKSREIVAGYAERFTISATLLMGFLVAIFGFPCTGGIYIATLALLASQETYFKGLLYLLLYNLMFVLPLIIIFLAATNRLVAEKLIDLNEKNQPLFRLIIGLITLVLGLALVFWLKG